MHLCMSMPSMMAPAFRCEKVTPTSLELHYYSPRPALWPIVKGIVLACASDMFHHEATCELIAGREEGTSDHEVFLITYPFQAQMLDFEIQDAVAQSSMYGLTNAQFYKLFPFHILLDDQCCVLQTGSALQRLFPETLARGTHIKETFALRHPHIEYGYDAMCKDSSTSFLLTAGNGEGMELKGMIFPTDASVAFGAASQRAMLFLASPRVASLDDMQRFKLYLSDIPLHDMSRDYVLLAEQRAAEVDLKNRYERNLNELNKATAELNATNERLAAEQARSDALLYQMLPRVVADKLRRGAHARQTCMLTRCATDALLALRSRPLAQRRRSTRWSTTR